MSLHNTLNHSATDKLNWLQKEYPEAIKFIIDHGDDESSVSYEACVTGKEKRRPFINKSASRYEPLDALSSGTIGPMTEEDIHGNKYLQLLYDSGKGFTMGELMKAKSSASNVIIRAWARMQMVCDR